MKARSRDLLDRAIAAMVASIDVYNKPDFPYRAESFTILALNAWELLLKAKWLASNKNKLNVLFVRQDRSGSRPTRYKRTRSGSPMTHSIHYLTQKLFDKKILDKSAMSNLDALIELRDTAVHFYHRNPELAEHLQEIGMACLKNFVSAVQDWFQEDLSRFNFYLMPLSFVTSYPSIETVRLNRAENAFIDFLNRLKPEEEDPLDRYSVTVNVEVRFVRSKNAGAASVRITDDPNVPAVRITEEQVLERYPWNYSNLVEQCRERYSDFKADQKFHELRKELVKKARLVHERRLDPTRPKPKKMFFSPDILKEFDKHYVQKISF